MHRAIRVKNKNDDVQKLFHSLLSCTIITFLTSWNSFNNFIKSYQVLLNFINLSNHL